MQYICNIKTLFFFLIFFQHKNPALETQTKTLVGGFATNDNWKPMAPMKTYLKTREKFVLYVSMCVCMCI